MWRTCWPEALRDNPGLHLIAVIPRFPDQDGRFSEPPNLIGRADAIRLLREAGGDRVAIYGIENEQGTPIYVHAKVCVIDDTWATIGSDNLNRRSWTHDSELTCAVLDEVQVDEAAGDGRGPGLARARASRPACARPSLTSTSAAGRVPRRCRQQRCSRRSGSRPPGSMPGTTTAGSAGGRQAGCAGTQISTVG